MKEVGEAASVRLLIAVLALGVTRLSAKTIHVVLDSAYCSKVSGTEIACNYTKSTAKEIILHPHPTGCDKWKTLRLIGAEKLDVTISCLDRIIVSSSREVNVTVYEAEGERQRTLNINNSNVTSLEGPVGRLYIKESRVTSLTTPRVKDLDLANSWVGSLNSVVGDNHDSSFTNSIIEVVDHLHVVGDKSLTITGGRIGVVKNLTISSKVSSKLEHVVIDRVPKGGLQIRNGDLTLNNVTIRSLETKAIVVVDDKVTFSSCKIEKALVDSVVLSNQGTLELVDTSIGKTQYSFSLVSSTMTFPFALTDLFKGLSTWPMVGSAFAGGFIVLILTLAIIIILRYKLGSCRVKHPQRDIALIPKGFENNYDFEVGSLAEADQRKSIRQRLPPPPPPPVEEDDEDDLKTSFGRMLVSDPSTPGLGQAPGPPFELP